MRRRIWAVGLCAAAAALSFTFFIMTFVCGAMQVEGNEPGEPRNEPICVSNPHPVAAIFGVVAVVAAFLAWNAHAWPVVAAGALVTAAGLLFIFSMGFFGFPVGILILVAGGLMLGRRERRADAPAPT
jgi:hypothetical protein